MLKRICPVSVLLILAILLPIAVKSDSGYVSSSATASSYSPQTRKSNYQPETKSIVSYSQISMSEQLLSQPNQSLLEKTIAFVPDDYLKPKEYKFNLALNEKFLAFDGASQSGDLDVSYTIKSPDGTVVKTQVTTVTNPMHYETVNPAAGNWSVTSTLMDRGETTAWIQAISLQNGTRLVKDMEKAKLNLISGQAIYFKIPLQSADDWFYLSVNRLALGHINVNLRKQDSYAVSYRPYYDSANEFFSSKQHTAGTYLLSIVNNDRVDVFLQITKPQGIKLKIDIDEGRIVNCKYEVDHDFFNFTVSQTYPLMVFDATVLNSSMSAQILLISPDLDVIFQETSSSSSDFREAWISKPSVGKYVLGVFGSGYAALSVKMTSAVTIEKVGTPRLDRTYAFAQSGQTVYLNISNSQAYLMLTGTTLSSRRMRYAIRDSNLNLKWSWEPQTGTGFSGLIEVTAPFYIIKIQGETQSSALVHLRSRGFEDYSVSTPDASNYFSRFQGDIVLTNITVKPSSTNLFQFSGATTSGVYVGLFDNEYNGLWSRTFSQAFETDFRRWRKGHENLPAGQWLQVVISQEEQSSGDKKLVEISSLQTGDESKYIMTPYQFTETVDWSNWWQMRVYKVYIGSPKWFGVVSQLLPVNTNYNVHPYGTMWIYDSTLEEQISSQHLYYENQWYRNVFATNFWEYPESGTWTIVMVGFKHSTVDPLNLSVSLVGEADFHRNWPANLTGTITSFPIAVNNTIYNIETKSNSTIPKTSFSYSELDQEIDFSVVGLQGTNGYAVVTAPKRLGRGPFSIFIDNNLQNGILSIENNTHTSVYFSYTHSEHQVRIVYATPGRAKITVKASPSQHGSPDPPYGEKWYDGGEEITATVNEVADETQDTRYRCIGWNGTGAVSPQYGTETTVLFRLSQHSTLTWNWGIQYKLDLKTNPTGLSPLPDVSPLGLWYDSNSTVSLISQNIAGYQFSYWTVDGVNMGYRGDITVKMDRPHSVVAHYTVQPGNLNILVKDENTGNSISQATVQSTSQPVNQTALKATTYGDGQCTFNNIKPGFYSVEVSKTGYMTEAKRVSVTAGQTTSEEIYMLPLVPGKSALRVYVLDSGGNPVSETKIVSINQPTGQSALEGTTDFNGYIAFKNISVGSYTIEASKGDYVMQRKVVDLSADRTTTLTIYFLRIDETGNLIVFVRDSKWAPISEATVNSNSQPEVQLPLNSITNATGYVEFTYIAAGSYIIGVSKKGYVATSMNVTVERQKTANVTAQLELDHTPPTVDVTVDLANPDTTQTIHFYVNAYDESDGSGIAKVSLYIDQHLAAEWFEAGTHTYTVGPIHKGTHTYYAVAADNAGNEATDPSQGEHTFEVVDPPLQTLWMLLTAVSIAALTTAGAALLVRRRSRGKKFKETVAQTPKTISSQNCCIVNTILGF